MITTATVGSNGLAAVVVEERRRLPWPVVVGIGLTWVVAGATHVAGLADDVHHDALLGHGDLSLGAVGLYVIVWTAMVAGMMLPSATPLLRLFVAASTNQPKAGTVLAAFISAYLLVWVGFGVVALFVDTVVHHVAERIDLVHDHPQLVAAAVLGVVGAFQFSKLKERCLTECRHPGAYLLRHYRRGTGAAWRLGWGHGVFCLGCCWALMLVMFVVGVANLVGMAAIGALMAYEKIGRHGETVARLAGVALLGVAVIVGASSLT